MEMKKTNVTVTLIGLMLGIVLANLDSTIVSTAMPTIIKDLQGISLYSWVFTVYMLALTTSTPLFGKLADLYGRKRMYMIGVILFLLGSALCGLAQNMTQLIIFRGIQGVGGGALMPITFTLIADLFPPTEMGNSKKLAKMQGVFGGVIALSSIIGPAVGGFIVDHWSWNWVFYINLPVGIIAMFLIATGFHEQGERTKQSIDWFGALTLSAGIISILLALVLGGDPKGAGTHYAWDSPQIIGLFTAGAILLGLFIWIETKVKDPIIALPLFKNRVVSIASIVAFFVGVGLFGAITYIPLFVQGVIGVSPSLAGYILTPLMISTIIASVIGGQLLTRTSYRTIIGTGILLMVLGFWLMSQMDVHTSEWTVIVNMMVAGLGMGLVMPTLNTSVQGEVEKEKRGISTSLVLFTRMMGGTVGVSVMGVIMVNQMTSGLQKVGEKFRHIPAALLSKLSNPQILLDAHAKAMLPPPVLAELQHVFVDSLAWVFITGALMVVAGLVVSLFLGKARLKVENNKQDEGNGAEHTAI